MLIIVQWTQFSIDTPHIMHCYYMFRPTVAIIRYTEPLQFPSFYLLYLPTLASVYTLGVSCSGILSILSSGI
jgi:hypothetical protein